MKSTQAMRDRVRELMSKEADDYDRAVGCVLDDLEGLLRVAPEPLGPLYDSRNPNHGRSGGLRIPEPDDNIEALALADRIDAWSPGKSLLVFIARERRMISEALRSAATSAPSTLTRTDDIHAWNDKAFPKATSADPVAWEVTDRMGFVLLFRVEDVADDHVLRCGGVKKALGYAAPTPSPDAGQDLLTDASARHDLLAIAEIKAGNYTDMPPLGDSCRRIPSPDANAVREALVQALDRMIDAQRWHDERLGLPQMGAAIEMARAALATPSPSTATSAEPVAHLRTTNFQEVLCGKPNSCDWPECECRRKASVHSPEASNYAFSKARELLIAAGLHETAAILHDFRPTTTPPSSGNADSVSFRDVLVSLRRQMIDTANEAVEHGGAITIGPLNRYVKEIDAALSSAPVAGEWLPISSISPSEHRKGYLVARPGDWPIRAYRTPGGDWYMHGASSVKLTGEFEPTLWQPLPEPPPFPRNERGTPKCADCASRYANTGGCRDCEGP